jgi:hypothetical protein
MNRNAQSRETNGDPTLSFVDRGETERALLRRLLGEIEAGAMETLPNFLPLGRIHPGRSRRCFLIGHVASPLRRAIRSSRLINTPSKLARMSSSEGDPIGLPLRACSEHRP